MCLLCLFVATLIVRLCVASSGGLLDEGSDDVLSGLFGFALVLLREGLGRGAGAETYVERHLIFSLDILCHCLATIVLDGVTAAAVLEP